MKKIVFIFLLFPLRGFSAGGEIRGTHERLKDTDQVQNLLKDLPCIVQEREGTQRSDSVSIQVEDSPLLKSSYVVIPITILGVWMYASKMRPLLCKKISKMEKGYPKRILRIIALDF